MGKPAAMADHFDAVAGHYRDVRTTDEEPIRFIRDALAGRAAIAAADIGCGAGRYDLLLFRHLPNLRLTCVDSSPEMLAELSRYLAGEGIADFETVTARVEDLDLGERSLDCVFTFNAVHHFDFPGFIAKAGGFLRDDGRIFIYTRTRRQNANSVWGNHFPGFWEKETRLYELEEMERWVRETGRVRLIGTRTFRYARTATLDHLLTRARSRHYSTFSLYTPEDFEDALGAFADNIRRNFDDVDNVRWHDENVMLQFGP